MARARAQSAGAGIVCVCGCVLYLHNDGGIESVTLLAFMGIIGIAAKPRV